MSESGGGAFGTTILYTESLPCGGHLAAKINSKTDQREQHTNGALFFRKELALEACPRKKNAEIYCIFVSETTIIFLKNLFSDRLIRVCPRIHKS